MYHWDNTAAALLTGAHRNLLPMRLTLVSAFTLKLDFATLGEQRRNFADAQLNCLLNCPIHALPA